MTATSFVRRAAAAVLCSILSSSLFAQVLTVPPLTAGTTARVSYSNPSFAGKRIVITVTGGTPSTTHEIFVDLDASGNGSKSWLVPSSWVLATFNAPGCDQQAADVN